MHRPLKTAILETMVRPIGAVMTMIGSNVARVAAMMLAAVGARVASVLMVCDRCARL
jgi:hypothetical protein